MATRAKRSRRHCTSHSKRIPTSRSLNRLAKTRQDLRPKASKSKTTQEFKHKPLDHDKPSIRLIQVLPELSSYGHMQCTVRHSNVDDEYTCLSYVWGEEDKVNPIIINGRRFEVRRNLWDFLSEARERYHSRPFWIDAICIDQTDILERNHQVQQMGQIFSHAIEVIAWLGTDAGIICYLDSPRLRDKHKERVLQLDYWKRAWITQEVELARSLRFVSRQQDVHLNRVLRTYMSPGGDQHLSTTINSDGFQGQPLLKLLFQLKGKECKVKRDRIYSLLALCEEGSRIRPDYGISDEEVFVQVLQSCRDSLCFCTVVNVAEALGLQSLSSAVPKLLKERMPAQIQLAAARNESWICPDCNVLIPEFWKPLEVDSVCLGSRRAYLKGHILCQKTSPDLIYRVFLDAQNPSYSGLPEIGFIMDDIRFLRGAGENVYTLQLSLGALLKLVRRADFKYRNDLQRRMGHGGRLQLLL